MTMKSIERFVWHLQGMVLAGLLCGQAHGAHVSFESGIPPDVRGSSNVTVSTSTDHAKFGSSSLKIEWAAATASKSIKLGPLLPVSASGGSFWLYSQTNHPGATVRVELLDALDAPVGYFDLNMEFSGWRGIFWKASFFSTVPNGSSFFSMRFVFPDALPANTAYIDGLFYQNTALNGSEDYKIWPDLNFDGPGESASDLHWNLYPDFKAYPVPTGEAKYSAVVTPGELNDLQALKSAYDLFSTAALTASSYNSAVASFNTWNITANGNGTVKGTPLFYKDMGYGTTDAPSNFITFQDDFIKVVNAYVQAEEKGPANYATDLKTKALLMARHGRDQGFSYGSANGSMSHYGYAARNCCLGLFRLRHALATAGQANQAADDMAWMYVQRRVFNPETGGSGDDIGTTMTGRLLSILMIPNEQTAARILRYFPSKLVNYLTPADQPTKPDGAWWHHGMMLPTYQPVQLGAGAPIIKNLQRTQNFRISEGAHEIFKQACLHYLWFGDGAMPVSLQGRSPGQTSGANTAKGLAQNMAAAGTPDGSDTIDREMAAQYIRLNGGVAGEFSGQGIVSEPLSGNRTMPYGAWMGHRRDNWLVSLKGHSRYQTFGESLSGGGKWKYMSHGTLEVLNPKSSVNYGIGQGWDWTRYPGTTVLRRGTESVAAGVTQISYSGMNFPSYGSWALGRRRFVGGLSHQGMNGCYVMQVEGAPGSNFDQMTADTDMVANKGYFFFDDRVVCLGNSISATNASYPMETTLIQNEWNSGEVIQLDGSPISLPAATSAKTTLTTLLDQHDVGYYIAGGQSFNLALRPQLPQDGVQRNMFQAWLGHGVAPNNKTYEYAILPQTTSAKLAQFSSEMQTSGSEPYVVRVNSGTAQIVWDRASNTTAYIIYPTADSYSGGYNEAVNYTPFGAADLLQDIDEAALVMLQPLGGQTVAVSVSDPNLGTSLNDHYAINSPVNTKTLVVEGSWKLRETPSAAVRIVSTTASVTTLEVDCQHGASNSFVMVDALNNNPPHQTGAVGSYQINGGTSAQYDLSALFSDPEGGVVFSMLNGPAWIDVTSNGIMTIEAPFQGSPTSHAKTLRVTDTGGLYLDVQIVVNVVQQPTLFFTPKAMTVYLAPDESTAIGFDVGYAGGGSIGFALSNAAPWLTISSTAPLCANGNFQNSTTATGWTITDIPSAGDHASQGFYASGSWTPVPATGNAYYNLGRSTQISQITPVTMVEGNTYRVRLSIRQASSSYGVMQVALTNGSGADLVMVPGNAYSATIGAGNGSSFNVSSTIGATYEASFVAGAAQQGLALGIRIASVRDVSTALLAVDDIEILADLPSGGSVTHQATINATGLSIGTYNGIVVANDQKGVVPSANLAVTLIVTTDRDGDGIPDRWELLYSGSATGLLPDGDNDFDGITNLDEYIFGYNPIVANAPLKIVSVDIGSSVEVEFSTTTNTRLYAIEFSEHLVEWTSLTSPVVGTNGVTTINVPKSGTNTGFYRVKVSVPE